MGSNHTFPIYSITAISSSPAHASPSLTHYDAENHRVSYSQQLRVNKHLRSSSVNSLKSYILSQIGDQLLIFALNVLFLHEFLLFMFFHSAQILLEQLSAR